MGLLGGGRGGGGGGLSNKPDSGLKSWGGRGWGLIKSQTYFITKERNVILVSVWSSSSGAIVNRNQQINACQIKLFLKRGGKPEYLEKNLLVQSRQNREPTNSTHIRTLYVAQSWTQTGDTLVGGEFFSHH